MSATFSLYIIAERGVLPSEQAWLRALEVLSDELVEGEALQVRAKQPPATDPERLFTLARAATNRAHVPVFLNGPMEQARQFGFDGAHWPEAIIPNGPVCPGQLAGASVHSYGSRRRAEAAGASFVVAGPVYDPGSKPGHGHGLEAFSAIVAAARVPVLAVGGISAQRIKACMAAGADGVAVVSGVLTRPDIPAAISEYRAALAAASPAGGTR
jgi:thiamine-phosphate pyrophosphorylase